MTISGRLEDNVLILDVNGRIDTDHAEEADQKIEELQKKYPAEHMVIDAAGLEYIASAGLRVVLKYARQDKKLRIINTSEAVYNIFYITGFTDIMTVEQAADADKVHEKDFSGINDTRWDYEFSSTVEMFEKQAAAHPDRLAVVSSQMSMTYEEMNETCNRIANLLHYYNVRPDDTVMILLPRSILTYVANMGILKSGASFVVANLSYPDERIQFMYEDAGCKYLITNHHVAFNRLDLIIGLGKRPLFIEKIMTSPWTQNPGRRIDESDLAYCIYTSGSTGKPKGVMIEHGNLANFLHHNPKNYETMGIVERGSVELAVAPLTFDVSIMEEFIPLTSGMTVALATEEEIMNPLKMRDFILAHDVDAMCCTPSYFNSLLALPQLNEALGRIKVIDFGAEAFPGSLYEKIRAVNKDVYIMNGYGPTEATISCTMKVMDGGENVTIGIPNSNVFCYIVDDDLNELPQGEVGELLVCGKGVGRGYKNLPDKTKAVFVTFRGMKAYRTGDLARITEDGEIEYHGRQDSQIKLHGLRIELGEIEENMSKHPMIDLCAAAPIENRYLCLYYTVKGEVDKEELKAFARDHLAHYMVPEIFVQLDVMPLTQNMKIDRKALPKPELPKVEVREAESPMQEKILERVRSVITDADIGIDTNLFDAGMSSLDVIVLLGFLSDEYQVALNIKDMEENPSVLQLEQMIQSKPKMKQREKKDRYPALVIQSVDYSEWSHQNAPSHTIPVMLNLDLSVDTDRLLMAVKTAILAHPGLSTRFEVADGMIWQVPCEDVSTHYEPEIEKVSEDQMAGIKEKLALELMEPSALPLYLVRLYETEKQKHLFIRFAHAISDADSIAILVRDIVLAYEGKELAKEGMTIFEAGDETFDLMTSPLYVHTLAYYKKLTEGMDAWMDVPGDLSEEVFRLGTAERTISVGRKEIEAYCKENKTTVNTFFAGLTAITFSSLTGQDRSSYMLTYNGRNDSRLTNTFGFLATLLPVCTKLDRESSFSDFLNEMQKQLVHTMGNAAFPIQDMAAKYPTMFEYLFVLQSEEDQLTMDGKPVEVEWLSENVGSSLSKMVVQILTLEDTYQIRIDYHANRYSEDYMKHMLDNMDCFVKAGMEGKLLGELLKHD